MEASSAKESLEGCDLWKRFFSMLLANQAGVCGSNTGNVEA